MQNQSENNQNSENVNLPPSTKDESTKNAINKEANEEKIQKIEITHTDYPGVNPSMNEQETIEKDQETKNEESLQRIEFFTVGKPRRYLSDRRKSRDGQKAKPNKGKDQAEAKPLPNSPKKIKRNPKNQKKEKIENTVENEDLLGMKIQNRPRKRVQRANVNQRQHIDHENSKSPSRSYTPSRNLARRLGIDQDRIEIKSGYMQPTFSARAKQIGKLDFELSPSQKYLAERSRRPRASGSIMSRHTIKSIDRSPLSQLNESNSFFAHQEDRSKKKLMNPKSKRITKKYVSQYSQKYIRGKEIRYIGDIANKNYEPIANTLRKSANLSEKLANNKEKEKKVKRRTKEKRRQAKEDSIKTKTNQNLKDNFEFSPRQNSPCPERFERTPELNLGKAGATLKSSTHEITSFTKEDSLDGSRGFILKLRVKNSSSKNSEAKDLEIIQSYENKVKNFDTAYRSARMNQEYGSNFTKNFQGVRESIKKIQNLENSFNQDFVRKR